MTDYRVYLTKSSEVARILAEAHQVGVDDVKGISSGAIGDDGRIPELYHGCGYYKCIVAREAKDPGYQIIFA